MWWWSAFFLAGRATHWLALKEIFVIVLISTSPIWFGTLILYIFPTNTYTIRELTFSILKNGELFPYCMSTVATILWLTNTKWTSEDPTFAYKFPPKLWPNIFSFIAFGVSLAFFGIYSVKVQMDSTSIIQISSILYFSCIIVYYIVTILSNLPMENLKESYRKGADKFGERLNNSRHENGK